MAYKCPSCGTEKEEMGDCPSCNVPMNEKETETETTEETQTEETAPEEESSAE